MEHFGPFLDGHRHFERRADDEDDTRAGTPPPSLAVSEAGILRPQSRDLATRSPPPKALRGFEIFLADPKREELKKNDSNNSDA
ncbi:hypothetical protein AVEN_268799-1 [Araneus ventricosus]|uniref:Uncharacterized protein n=1 Tax=Araneus ventricosus TaxID=182803 RepID=A0A4Y2UAS0_ARAVE|nr:hypothetical protein AVEN_268799-1 [Araneus ventricosus]